MSMHLLANDASKVAARSEHDAVAMDEAADDAAAMGGGVDDAMGENVVEEAVVVMAGSRYRAGTLCDFAFQTRCGFCGLACDAGRAHQPADRIHNCPIERTVQHYVRFVHVS